MIIQTLDEIHFHLKPKQFSCEFSIVDSPKWLNNKRIKTNPKNNDDMCFNCVATSALNHG